MTNDEWVALWQALGRSFNAYCAVVLLRLDEDETPPSEELTRKFTAQVEANVVLQHKVSSVRIQLDGQLSNIPAQSPLTLDVLANFLDNVAIMQEIEQTCNNTENCDCDVCDTVMVHGEAIKFFVKLLASAEIIPAQ